MSRTTRMPESIKRIYREVAAVAPGALIAGGAVRDTINNVPIKDVDIFVDQQHAHFFYDMFTGSRWHRLSGEFDSIVTAQPTSANLTTNHHAAHPNHRIGQISTGKLRGTVTTITATTSNAKQISAASDEDGYTSSGIVEVWELGAWAGDWDYPINVIFTNGNPLDYVRDRFDFGICKAWYDGTFINMHGDFISDVNNKTITMVLTNKQLCDLYGTVENGIKRLMKHATRIQQKYPTHQLIMPTV